MRTFFITVFLKLKSGKRDNEDDFPPFLTLSYSHTLHLGLQVVSLLKFVICCLSGATQDTDRIQEYEELWLCLLQTSEKTFIGGGIKYIRKSGHQPSKKSVLILAQTAVFQFFIVGQ